MPASTQRIFFKRRELLDDEILAQCGITSISDILELALVPSVSCQFRVGTVLFGEDGIKFSLNIPATIKSLKVFLRDYFGVAEQYQYLFWRGRLLLDTETLLGCGFRPRNEYISMIKSAPNLNISRIHVLSLFQ